MFESSQEAEGSLGFKGERGYSAYEIDVQHGYEGTEEEWLEHLAGELSDYVNTSDVIDNLTSDFSSKPLSAKQGKTLKTMVDGKPNNSDLTALENEIYDNVYGKQETYNKQEIGSINDLDTDDKTSIVNAINELVEGQLGIKTNKILATPGAFMNEGQTYNFSDSVSNQTNGIVLVWSAYYDSAPADWNWNFTYVPKYWVANHNNNGVTCVLFGPKFADAGCKYVYVNNNSIRGTANNEGSGTSSGISYNNSKYVLRYVIGI